MGVLRDQPHHAPAVVAVELDELHAVERNRATLVREEAQQHPGERRLAGAARPDDSYTPARAQVEVDSRRAPSGLGPDSGSAGPRVRRHSVRRHPLSASATGSRAPAPAGRFHHSNTRAAERRTRCSVWVAVGSARPARRRPAGSARSRRAARLILPRGPRETPTNERAPHREALRTGSQALTDTRGAGSPRREPRQLRVGGQCAPELLRRGAVDGQLGAPSMQVDHRGRQLAPSPPPAAPLYARRAPRSATARASRRSAAPSAGSGPRQAASTTRRTTSPPRPAARSRTGAPP